MRFRSLAMSALWMGIFVTTVMALRAADDKAKGKTEELPPSPGTVKFATAPKAVQNAFNVETKNATIEVLGKSDDGEFYRAIVGLGASGGKNNYLFSISKTGQVLEKSLQPIRSEIKQAEIPPAVQKTVNDEAKGAKIEAVEKVVGGKRADYVLDVTLSNGAYQLMIADDGTLLSKVILADDEEPSTAKPKDKVADPKKKQ